MPLTQAGSASRLGMAYPVDSSVAPYFQGQVVASPMPFDFVPGMIFTASPMIPVSMESRSSVPASSAFPFNQSTSHHASRFLQSPPRVSSEPISVSISPDKPALKSEPINAIPISNVDSPVRCFVHRRTDLFRITKLEVMEKLLIL
jgi:hypothetical protein